MIPIGILIFLGIFHIRLENFLFGILNIFFELILFAYVIINIRKVRVDILWVLAISLLYVSASFSYACIVNGDHPLDFLTAYKAFFYLIFLSFCLGKPFVSDNKVLWLYNILLGSFLISYLVTVLFFKDSRPKLLGENNYEMMFFAIIIYLKHLKFNRFSWIETSLCFVVFILSGSRSGLVIFVFVLFAIYIKKINFKTVIVSIVLAIPALFALYFVFMTRLKGGDVESIDRYRMLILFVKEISGWNWSNYLFGTPPLTNMSNLICTAGEFAYSLKNHSYKGDGSCYSVVLHSYLLRSLFDHGLVGLAFISASVYTLLRKSFYSIKESLVFSGIILLNSLSVSGYNSIFAMLGISIVLQTYNEANKHTRD